MISEPCWKTLLENASPEVLPLKYLNYPKNYPKNLSLFITATSPLMGSSVRAGPESSRAAAPLPTGFLAYLTFPSIFREENNKKGRNSRALAALI